MLVASLAWLAVAAEPAAVDPIRRVPAASVVILARGDTAFVEVSAPLREALESTDLEARTTSMRPPGVSVLAWTEEARLLPGKRAMISAPLIVRIDPLAPLGDARVSVRADVVEAGSQRLVAILPFEGVIRVVEAAPTLDSVARAERARAHFAERARASARLVTSIGLDGLQLPSRASTLTGTEKLALEAFLANQLRAEAARDHLRTAADAADDAVGIAAWSALARMAEPFPPASDRPAPLHSPAKTLDQALVRFTRHELDLAHRLAYRARMTPSLPPARVAEALSRLGMIEVARGATELGTRLLGQALCLSPGLPLPVERGPAREAIDELVRRGRCPRALGPHSATAQAATTEDGEPGALVRALFGPDPFHAIEWGRLELLDAGGAVRAVREVQSSRGDLASIEAVFGAAELGDTSGGVIVRARAFDVAGIELASQGPTVVPLAVPEEEPIDIPWWIWVAGGAAVVAAGGVAIAAASGGDPTRAIGPVMVRF